MWSCMKAQTFLSTLKDSWSLIGLFPRMRTLLPTIRSAKLLDPFRWFDTDRERKRFVRPQLPTIDINDRNKAHPRRTKTVVVEDGTKAMDESNLACRMCHFSGSDVRLSCGCTLHAVSWMFGRHKKIATTVVGRALCIDEQSVGANVPLRV
jgi:hypothetical protein